MIFAVALLGMILLVSLHDLVRAGRAARVLDAAQQLLELRPLPAHQGRITVPVPAPVTRPAPMPGGVQGTLRLGVGHAPSCYQELRIGRADRLVAGHGQRLHVHLRRELDLVVQASEDLGFAESVVRLQRARAALERLLPPAAPRSVEVGLDAVTLLADDELTPDQQEVALLDLAEVARSLAIPVVAREVVTPPPAPLPPRRSLLWASGRLQAPAPRSVVLGAGQIVARSRAAGPLRCAFCHDGLEDAPARCPGCDTAVHADCVEELRRCPTAGCDELRKAA